MSSDPTSSYHQGSARGASPIGNILALYDTILRDFGRALGALQAGDIEMRVFELNHAVMVIGHLQSVLDHEQGGEPASHLDRFYNVTRGLIVQANFEPTTESIEELIALYSGVRQAWYQAELESRTVQEKPPASQADWSAGDMRPAEDCPESDDVNTSQFQWSA